MNADKCESCGVDTETAVETMDGKIICEDCADEKRRRDEKKKKRRKDNEETTAINVATISVLGGF